MEEYIENEQWKHLADCSRCRRKNYCSKGCTLRKWLDNKHIDNSVVSKRHEECGN